MKIFNFFEISFAVLHELKWQIKRLCKCILPQTVDPVQNPFTTKTNANPPKPKSPQKKCSLPNLLLSWDSWILNPSLCPERSPQGPWVTLYPHILQPKENSRGRRVEKVMVNQCACAISSWRDGVETVLTTIQYQVRSHNFEFTLVYHFNKAFSVVMCLEGPTKWQPQRWHRSPGPRGVPEVDPVMYKLRITNLSFLSTSYEALKLIADKKLNNCACIHRVLHNKRAMAL